MSGDEEFDSEAFAAYEDELYREKSLSSNEDELDSEVEETLYSQVHYASSLLVPDELSAGKKSPEICSGSDNAGKKDRPQPCIEENCSGIPVIVISSDDDNGSKKVNLEASCSSYPEVVRVFSKERTTTTTTSSLTKEATLGPGGESLGKIEGNWDLDERDLGAATRSKQRPRYYKPTKRPSYVRCCNCNERGHLSEYCPEPKKTSVCCLCGLAGHVRRSCPNELCFNCHEPGHQWKECRQPRVRPFDRCKRCYMTGHLAKDCPDLWRRYHITTRVGPVIRPSRCPSPRGDVFCYNCGQQGHHGHECTEERPWRHNGVTLPFIVSYDRCINVSSGRREENRKSRGRVDQHDRSAPGCNYQRQDRSMVTEFAHPPLGKKRKRYQDERIRNASFDDESHARGLQIGLSSGNTNNTRKKKAKKKKKKTTLQDPELVPTRRIVEVLDRSPSDDGLIEEPCGVGNIRKPGKKRRRDSDRFESKPINNYNSKRRYEKSSSKPLRARDNGSFRRRDFDTRRTFSNPRREGRGFVSNRGFRFDRGKN